MLDIGLIVFKRPDLGLINIESDAPKSFLRKAKGKWQSYVAETDDADGGLFGFNLKDY